MRPRQAAAELGVLRPIVGLFAAATSAMTQVDAAAADAIAVICNSSTAIRQQVVDLGGLLPLIRLVSSSGWQDAAQGALDQLAAFESIRQLIQSLRRR